MNEFMNLGITVPYGRTSGNIKTKCPKCSNSRHNKSDRSLSVNLDSGLFNCHYCGYSGMAYQKDEFRKAPKNYVKPTWNNRTEIDDRVVKWFEDRSISQETIKKLRITSGIEYIPQKQKECNVIQFNYFKDDELINIKSRTSDKCFKLVSGAELILYNIDSLKGEKEAYITEGECDCASFIECGYKPVVSVPNGANGTDYLDDYIEEYFDNKETIYIAVDTDKKGIQLRDDLVRRLGVERCKIVTYGEGCKDANEHLIKYGSYSLKERINKAEDIRVFGVFSIMDYETELDHLYQNGLQRGYTIGHDAFDRLISFEVGRVCLVTGIPGMGKSEFVDEIVVLLNILYGLKAAYFSPENFPMTYLISKLVSKLTGKKFGQSTLPRIEYDEAKGYLNDNFFSIYPDDDLTLDAILDKAKYLIKRKGVKILVIDPWNKLDHQVPIGMSETQYISKALDKISNFAKQYGILIFVVAHPTKMKKGNDGLFEIPTLYDISGSAHFYNKADYGITIHRDRVREVVLACIQKVKFKHLGEVGETEFKYNLNNGRYVPFWGQTQINWDNENYLLRIKRKLNDATQSDLDWNDSERFISITEDQFLSDTTPNDQLPF